MRIGRMKLFNICKLVISKLVNKKSERIVANYFILFFRI